MIVPSNGRSTLWTTRLLHWHTTFTNSKLGTSQYLLIEHCKNPALMFDLLDERSGHSSRSRNVKVDGMQDCRGNEKKITYRMSVDTVVPMT